MSAPITKELANVVKYVLMPLQKIKICIAEANFSAESFIKDICTAWKVGIFNDA